MLFQMGFPQKSSDGSPSRAEGHPRFLSCITTLDLAKWVLRLVDPGSEGEAKGHTSLHAF